MTLLAASAVRADNVLVVGPWDDGGPIEPFAGCTLAFLIAWPGYVLDYPEHARRFHAAGIPFSLVLPDRRGVLPGAAESEPLAVAAYFSVEDPSPCWRCLELRQLGWSDEAVIDLRYLDHLKGAPDRPGLFPAPTEEQTVMLKWLAMDVTGADPGVAVHVAQDGRFTLHIYQPHPNCGACSPWAGAEPVERTVPLEWLGDARLGLIRPLPGELPRVQVANPSPRFIPTSFAPGATARRPQRLPVLQGGAEDDLAARSCMLDSLAAYAVDLRAGRPMWRGTRHGIPVSGVDPRPFIPYNGSRGSRLLRFQEGKELDWQRAHDLHRAHDVGVPADLVFSGPPWEGVMHAEMAGTVAHTSIEIGVRVALGQVAAMDALMQHWYARLTPPRIPDELLPEATQRDQVAAWREEGWDVAVVDLTTDIGVPALAVLARSRRRVPNWFYGCGADLDSSLALRRAFHCAIAAQARGDAAAPPLPKSLDFLFAGLPGALPDTHPDAYKAPIDTWRAKLRRIHLDAYWADITPPDVNPTGVSVVKVLIAQTLPLIREDVGGRPASERLLAMRVRLGRDTRPLAPEDVNPFPHPF